jgi:predicted phage terminase large subunit-like protein
MLDEELALEEAVALERARTSFEGFYRYINPGHEINWHHQLIFKELDRLVSGENKRLIITLPPRHGKSESVSRLFPAYMMGLEPDKNIIACSYATPLAQRMSRDVQRIMDDPAYQRIFPHIKLWGKNVRSIADGSYLRNSDIFEVVNHRGAYRAAGLGAGITGMGGDCFTGETRISTEYGSIPIADLFNHESPPRVLCYDVLQSKFVYRKIKAVRRRQSAALCQVQTASGRLLTCTPDHLLFTRADGFRKAAGAQGSELLIATKDLPGIQPKLPKVQEKGRPRRQLLQRLLHASAPLRGRSGVQYVQKAEEDDARRLHQESHQARARTLRQTLHDDLSDAASPEVVRGLRGKSGNARTQVLQRKLQGCTHGQTENRFGSAAVQRVREMDAPSIQKNTVLRHDMQKQGAQPADVGESKPLVCQWKQSVAGSLRKVVQNLAAPRKAQRWPYMLLLRENYERAICPRASYRREQRQQPADKFDYVVRVLPYSGTQKQDALGQEADSGSKKTYTVYDLQIEEHHNYFANEILVHNCLIIDDPVKDAADAMSSTIQDNQWEWYASTFRSRLAKGGRIAILATRWVFNDIIGRLIDLAGADPNSDQWRVIKLPAINETGPTEDDPREPGDALWPGYFPVAELEKQRATNSRQFEALYQCNPVPLSGNLVQDSWWREWQQAELPRKFEKVIISADLTFKGSSKGDWTVMIVMGKYQGRCYILDMVRRQVPFTGQQTALLWLYNDAMEKYGVREVIVEDAANGAAIIDQLRSKIPCLIAVRAGDASKESRAQAITPIIEAGNVLLPCPTRASWVQVFRTEWAQFPMAAHDDIVDAATYGISRLFPPRMSMLGAMPMGVAKPALPGMYPT